MASVKTVQFEGDDLYLTSPFVAFQEALEACRRLTVRPERMALILGEQGMGKTVGSRWFCSQHADACYIEVPPAPILRTGRLLKLIEAELGMAGGSTLFDRTLAIADELSRQPRMLVFDIGNRLRRYDYIDVLRYIHDRARARMAFVGTPALERVFREHAEFAGRVQIRHALRPTPLAEAMAIFRDFSDQAAAAIHEITGGRMRQMLVLAHAFRSNKIPLERRTPDAVRRVAQSLTVRAA